MRKKRLFAVVIVMTFLISSVIGINLINSKDVQARSVSKTVKVFTFYNGNTNDEPHPNLFDTPIGKEITKLTGVKLKIEYATGQDEATKIGLILASGDLPDLIYGGNEHGKLIEAKVLVPIENYIQKYGKYCKQIYSGKDLKRMKQQDGHIYFLTPHRNEISPDIKPDGFWLPIDLLEKAKWPKVRYWEDYLKLIRDYVKKNPKIEGYPTIGFTFITESWRFFTLENPPSYLMGYQNDGDVIVDPKTFEAKVYSTMEASKRYYRDLNKLWQEGLIDKEVFVQNYDTYLSKIAQGRVVGFYDQYWQFGYDAEESLKNAKKYNRLHISFPVVYRGVQRAKYVMRSPIGSRDGISITKKCKDPVGAFKFLDTLCSMEAQKLMYWGIKGVDYSVDKNGKMYLTDQQKKNREDPQYRRKRGLGYWWTFPHAYLKLQDGNYREPGFDPDYVYKNFTSAEKKVLDAYKAKTFMQLPFTDPPLETPYGFAWEINIPAERKDVTIAQQKMSEVRRKYLPRLVMAKPGEYDKIWNEFVKEFEKTNYKVYEKFKTEIIKWKVKNWN
ncbi:extracellular solute-binding protein [Caldicellulosiruptor changbaiensis]|uniref:Extracellular solute-binding protein n=2 Tax=Caldicellulosiruptor changbaiensis TaxID=1222016 RepID=A0A3T0D8C1_9FIRM|nr:extracellular solute-binding protein [Caldicellulosiruptor changbaiensis]